MWDKLIDYYIANTPQSGLPGLKRKLYCLSDTHMQKKVKN